MPNPAMAAANAALARANAERASKNYQQTQAFTVSPGQLVIMLYDGALRFLRQARTAMISSDYEQSHQFICRTEDIIAELDSTLDDSAGAVAVNLHRIYDYCLRRLVEANVKKDIAPLGEVISHLEGLLDSWRQAIQSVENTGTSGNVNGMQVRVDGQS